MEDPGGAKDLLIPFRVGPCVVADPLLARLAFPDLFDTGQAAARELVRHRLRQAFQPGYRVPLGREPFPGGRPAGALPVPPTISAAQRRLVGRQDELAELARRLAEGGRAAIAQPRRRSPAWVASADPARPPLRLRPPCRLRPDPWLVPRNRRRSPPATPASPALGSIPPDPDQAA